MKILLRILFILAMYIVPPALVFGLIVWVKWGFPNIDGKGFGLFRVLTTVWWIICSMATVSIALGRAAK